MLVPLVIVASDAAGNVVPGAAVSIKTPGGAVVQLYNGAAWVNSVVTDARGMTPGVYVLPGDYVVTITHATIGSIVYPWTASPGLRPLVAALPAAPVDGDEIYFQNATMAAAGVIWHLRYNGASANPYKWEYVGGGALSRYLGNDHTASTAYVDLTTPHNVIAPLAGEYEVDWGAQTYNATVTYSWLGMFIGNVFQAETTTFIGSANSQLPITSAWGFTIAAGADVRAKYRVNAGDATFLGRYLRIRPVRLG